jgi:SAM-dependent methyltransferase
MSTDQEWVRWGQQDPYFAVITNEKFRSAALTDVARKEFFESGQRHARYVLDSCRRFVDPAFKPKRVLDFGCGVGRVVLPFAQAAESVVGVDVSPAMLDEARRNCHEGGLKNVELVLSDDTLSAVNGEFDLVHSSIVLQHIDVVRGRKFFARLVSLLSEGGIGAIQVTYAKAYHPDSFGQPPRLAAPPAVQQASARLQQVSILGNAKAALRGLVRGKRGAPSPAAQPTEAAYPAPVTSPRGDPEMQMNPYNLTELAFILQTSGVTQFHACFTDHGGELGVFLFFRKTPRAPAANKPS